MFLIKNKFLILAGLIGFLLGVFHFPSLQDAVENAQIIAGIVEYPFQTPQLYFQKKLWSLPPQLLAILLSLGISEKVLSFFTSGVLGLTSFTGLSLIARSFYKKDHPGIAAIPLIIFFFLIFEFAPTYDISLIDTSSTSGTFGISWALITLGLYFNNKKSFSYFCLGLLASIHAIWFIWVSLSFILVFLIFEKSKKEIFLKYYKFLFSGILLSTISLTCYFLMREVLPINIVTNNKSQFASYFFENWDVHRRQIPLGLGLIMGLSLPLISYRHKKYSDIFNFSLVISGLTLFVTIYSQFNLPLMWLMPHRFINIAILLFGALLISSIDSRKKVIHICALLGSIIFLHYYYDLYRLYPEIKKEYLFNLGVLLLSFVGLNYIDIKKIKPHKYFHIPVIAVGLLISLYYLSFGKRAFVYSLNFYKDYNSSDFFKKISARKGFLLTCPNCSHFQLKTRSPIILEVDTMDDLAYGPEMADEFNSYFKALYGLDLYNRPKSWSRSVHVPKDVIKTDWEQRSEAQWSDLIKKYQLKGIIVPKYWKLPLESIENDKFRFYYKD